MTTINIRIEADGLDLTGMANLLDKIGSFTDDVNALGCEIGVEVSEFGFTFPAPTGDEDGEDNSDE